MASSSHRFGACDEQWERFHRGVRGDAVGRPDSPSNASPCGRDRPRGGRGPSKAQIAASMGNLQDTARKWRHCWCSAPRVSSLRERARSLTRSVTVTWIRTDQIVTGAVCREPWVPSGILPTVDTNNPASRLYQAFSYIKAAPGNGSVQDALSGALGLPAGRSPVEFYRYVGVMMTWPDSAKEQIEALSNQSHELLLRWYDPITTSMQYVRSSTMRSVA